MTTISITHGPNQTLSASHGPAQANADRTFKRAPLALAFSLAAALGLASATVSADEHAAAGAIDEQAVLAAQQAWGDGLLAIAAAHRDEGVDAARALAADIIDAAYAYAHGPVLFKPTLTSGEQTFRTTREGALAYFVGGDEGFPNDEGFALKPWTGFAFENAAVWIGDGKALTMGNVHLTDADGNVTTVDKTWGFKQDEAGDLRIVLHHSSLPFEG